MIQTLRPRSSKNTILLKGPANMKQYLFIDRSDGVLELWDAEVMEIASEAMTEHGTPSL